jgi:hypothetical protein
MTVLQYYVHSPRRMYDHPRERLHSRHSRSWIMQMTETLHDTESAGPQMVIFPAVVESNGPPTAHHWTQSWVTLIHSTFSHHMLLKINFNITPPLTSRSPVLFLSLKSVLQFSLLFAGLRRSGFKPRPVQLGLFVVKVVLSKFVSKYFGFPCQYHSINVLYSFIHLSSTLYSLTYWQRH